MLVAARLALAGRPKTAIGLICTTASGGGSRVVMMEQADHRGADWLLVLRSRFRTSIIPCLCDAGQRSPVSDRDVYECCVAAPLFSPLVWLLRFRGPGATCPGGLKFTWPACQPRPLPVTGPASNTGAAAPFTECLTGFRSHRAEHPITACCRCSRVALSVYEWYLTSPVRHHVHRAADFQTCRS